MQKIKKNDLVKVIAGKDNGKTGKVLGIFPKQNRAIVQGVNFIKRHLRRTSPDREAGIVQRETPLNLSNVMLICPRCNRPTRVGIIELKDKTRARKCKRCNEVIG
jgi:large subunit ribosomal protein L24